MKFAIHDSREVAVRHFNGVGYVVRHEMFPRTVHAPDGVSIYAQTTVQGHALYVGARLGDDLTVRRYKRPDSPPAYYPGYEA